MKTIILMIVSVMLASMVYADGQINIAYSPYTINQPGSYIVVKDLTATTNIPTISINTSDVTIDLNGHNIYGAGQITDGIWSAVGNNNITITNGVVRDWGHNGISLSGNDVQVSKVKSYNNGNQGFYLVGTSMRVIDCIADSNTRNGFEIGSNGIITGCIASNNGVGIYVGGNGCQVIENNTLSNTNGGIFVNAAGGLIKNNTASSNNAHGITIGGNGGCQIIENNVSYNASNGIDATQGGCLIKGNVAFHNTNGSGIFSQADNQIIENTCLSNSYGIYGAGGVIISRIISVIGIPTKGFIAFPAEGSTWNKTGSMVTTFR